MYTYIEYLHCTFPSKVQSFFFAAWAIQDVNNPRQIFSQLVTILKG